MASRRGLLTYLVTGVVLGHVTFVSIMAGVWGVRVRAAQYVALFGAFVLCVAAVISAFRDALGRRVACGADRRHTMVEINDGDGGRSQADAFSW